MTIYSYKIKCYITFILLRIGGFHFRRRRKTAVRRWFRAQPADFYNSGISKLVVRWDKCLNRGADYF
jgi:hypothetical protein